MYLNSNNNHQLSCVGPCIF